MPTEIDTPVLIEQAEAGVVMVRLNRPARANAMDMESIARLHDVIEEVSADRAVRVVILTGAGKAFCAGLDLKSVVDRHGELQLDGSGSYELQERFAGIVRWLVLHKNPSSQVIIQR